MKKLLLVSTIVSTLALGGCTAGPLGELLSANEVTSTNAFAPKSGKKGRTNIFAFANAKEVNEEIDDLEPLFLGGKDDLVSGPPPPDYKTFERKVRKGLYIPPEMEKARYMGLRGAAMGYAAQAGYYRRCYEIMKALEANSSRLSTVFDFNRVAYGTVVEAGFLLPPVVSRAEATIAVNDRKTEIVAADEFYRIEVPGRLVPVLPTWRDYLVLALEAPNDPEPSFLPRGKDEQIVYEHYLKQGWKAGTKQAEGAFQASMNLLRRDYLGMIEYRRAVQANVIDELVVEMEETRSAGDLNELFVGERRVKIIDSAKFQRNAGRWKTIKREL